MAKLILTHEVTGLGAPGDVVDVKDGYARNFLLPRGLATAWTKGAEKQIAAIRKARKSREIATLDDAQAARDALQARTVTHRGQGRRQRPAVRRGDARPTSPRPSWPAAARRSTSARSRSASRSRPSATTRCRSACTPTSPRRSTSGWSRQA